mmetsp:Transcript_8959/g.26902  ORF Transcript_8959/g.26902 Transcript_8959/m.26902 type:complete len:628 (+) Transcript_8959:143-2026(+)
MEVNEKQARVDAAAVLEAAIEYSLANHITGNAIFMAERLCAMDASEKNKRFLAQSLLRNGKPVQAKAVLENTTEPESKFLIGVLCIELNQLREAETALKPAKLDDYERCGSCEEADFPGGAAGIYHLGLVLQRTARAQAARAVYKKALKHNPLLWVAFEGLVFLGEETGDLLPADLNDEAALSFLGYHPNSPRPGNEQAPQATGSASSSPSVRPRGRFSLRDSTGREVSTEHDFVTPGAPQRSTARARRIPLSSISSRNVRMSFGSVPSPKQTLDAQGVDLEALADDHTEEKPITSCMDLLRRLGQGMQALAQYRCGDAVNCFSSLPEEQICTGYVLSSIGKAYLEIGDYQSAEAKFEEARAIDPARMDGLVEYYSTILWHQKKEVELADLARQAVETDRFSAATWCAAGNCFSLQKDPNTALKFFKRAVQVDPWSAYAHTLVGHEYVVKEDLESARASYREALAIDARHYNAWYGVGHVYQKQENYQMAEQYYREAIKIHPLRATLHYHLGCVLFATHAIEEAMKALNEALRLNPNNPIAKFERAKVLAFRGECDKAIEELQTLCDTLPKEAAVHYELGKLLKKNGDDSGALQNFSIALNLDPKARIYKKALYSLDHESEDMEEQM